MSLTNGQGYRITIRFPSGGVEHRYSRMLPEVGEEIELDGERGFVRAVEELDGGDVNVKVGRRPSHYGASRQPRSATTLDEPLTAGP